MVAIVTAHHLHGEGFVYLTFTLEGVSSVSTVSVQCNSQRIFSEGFSTSPGQRCWVFSYNSITLVFLFTRQSNIYIKWVFFPPSLFKPYILVFFTFIRFISGWGTVLDILQLSKINSIVNTLDDLCPFPRFLPDCFLSKWMPASLPAFV